ncbi:hypothetical protein VP1G_05647 [Cytospora mali]|uniref:Uncharacterized protein n=1 Tax=Cytospora mali TaxID=578113 RepID=A0A194V316_CYTMA|nr:hypothetical protein VP1G_05647 [Valsa mali var. pyri (nom. inval.)]
MSSTKPTSPGRYNGFPVEVLENIISNLVIAPEGITFNPSGHVHIPESLTGAAGASQEDRRHLLTNYLLVNKVFYQISKRIFLAENTFHLAAGSAEYHRILNVEGDPTPTDKTMLQQIRHVVLLVEVGRYAKDKKDEGVVAALERKLAAGSLRTLEVRITKLDREEPGVRLYELIKKVRRELLVAWGMPIRPRPRPVLWEEKARRLVRLLLHPGLLEAGLKTAADCHPDTWCKCHEEKLGGDEGAVVVPCSFVPLEMGLVGRRGMIGLIDIDLKALAQMFGISTDSASVAGSVAGLQSLSLE